MDGMGSALTGDKQKQRKTPQEFLGANSNLVNLDNLVKTDTTSKQGQSCLYTIKIVKNWEANDNNCNCSELELFGMEMQWSVQNGRLIDSVALIRLLLD